MHKFSVGDKIVPRDGEWDCAIAKKREADYAVIDKVYSNGYRYKLYKDGSKIDWCIICQHDSNSKLMEKTMENLQVGDVLVSKDFKGEHTVLEVLQNTALISFNEKPGEIFGWRTFSNLKRNFTIKSDEPETTELTMDEIATKFGVDVKNLKIKKQ